MFTGNKITNDVSVLQILFLIHSLTVFCDCVHLCRCKRWKFKCRRRRRRRFRHSRPRVVPNMPAEGAELITEAGVKKIFNCSSKLWTSSPPEPMPGKLSWKPSVASQTVWSFPMFLTELCFDLTGGRWLPTTWTSTPTAVWRETPKTSLTKQKLCRNSVRNALAVNCAPPWGVRTNFLFSPLFPDPHQKDEINRKAFEKFKKEHSAVPLTVDNAVPSERFDGKFYYI